MEQLMQAITSSNPDSVREILESGVVRDINEGQICFSPLTEACLCDNVDIVCILLAHGADVNGVSGQLQKRPLHAACDYPVEDGHLVQVLLEAGSEVDSQDEDGNTALHLACTRTHRNIVRLLLESGADVSLEDVDGESPLLRACYPADGKLIETLLQFGAVPTAMCLMTCMMHNCAVGVNLLYTARPDLEVVDALMSAIKLKLWEARTDLQSAGYSVGTEYDDRHIPPTHVVCSIPSFCSSEVLVSLLEVSPDVHRKDYAGCSCLQHACSTLYLKAVHVLMDYGSNSSRDGWRPLWKVFPAPTSDKMEDYLAIIHLLVLSGFQMDNESLDIFQKAAEQTPGLSPDERKRFKDIIADYRFSPLRLKDICRTGVRKYIPPSIQVNINKLRTHLPENLLGFLQFDDFLDPIPYNVRTVSETGLCC